MQDSAEALGSFLGAWQLPGGFNPFLYGTLGALITTYVTFLPCFFFIFAGSPYIEALAGNRRIQAALLRISHATDIFFSLCALIEELLLHARHARLARGPRAAGGRRR